MPVFLDKYANSAALNPRQGANVWSEVISNPDFRLALTMADSFLATDADLLLPHELFRISASR